MGWGGVASAEAGGRGPVVSHAGVFALAPARPPPPHNEICGGGGGRQTVLAQSAAKLIVSIAIPLPGATIYPFVAANRYNRLQRPELLRGRSRKLSVLRFRATELFGLVLEVAMQRAKAVR